MDVLLISYSHRVNNVNTLLGGTPPLLCNFLKTRVNKLVCIWQPYPYSDDLSPIVEIYEGGKLIRTLKFPRLFKWWKASYQTGPFFALLKIRDLISTIYFIIKIKSRFHVCIGAASDRALMGAMLRKIKYVNSVIYYIIDYADMWSNNPILNSVYHKFDNICSRVVDVIWNNSKTQTLARERKGLSQNEVAPQIIVPIGIDDYNIENISDNKIPRSAVYIGALYELDDNIRFMISGFKKVVNEIPDAMLYLIGPCNSIYELSQMIMSFGVEDNVKYVGTIVEPEMLVSSVSRFSIGLAIWPPKTQGTETTDPIKPRVYMVCGLPIIITKSSGVTSEIIEHNAGFGINYDEEEFTNALVALMLDQTQYETLKNNVIALGKKYLSTNIFQSAWDQSMLYLSNLH